MTETEFRAFMRYFRGDLLKYSCIFSLEKMNEALNFINIHNVHVRIKLQENVSFRNFLEPNKIDIVQYLSLASLG